jgi:uncharacterized membrane protein YkvA (DUF1232 family)
MILEKLKAFGKTVKSQIQVYRLLLKDSRTPIVSKMILGLAIGYLLLPFDLVPDFIPVLGYLDDVIFVPLLITLALKFIPSEVVADCRRKANTLP